MEPIPETVQAINGLDVFAADDDLLEQLEELGTRVRDLVPDCVGLSVAMRSHGVTFTLVATAAEVAVLDAVQYVAGGPCVDTIEDGEPRAVQQDVMDEEGWSLFAEATAAQGIASTLSLPVVVGEEVVGGVNLYAATAHAFDGHHVQLAEILGAWPGGAVTNADLSFSTRDAARQAPQRLRDEASLDVASGLLAARVRCSVEEARTRLEAAATQAGVDPARLSRSMLGLLG
jgi:GAF domain-containing protein